MELARSLSTIILVVESCRNTQGIKKRNKDKYKADRKYFVINLEGEKRVLYSFLKVYRFVH